MIFQCELDFYESIQDDLDIVFDVGCRADNPFAGYNCEVHQFDPMSQPGALGIFNQVALGSEPGRVEFHPEYQSIIHRTELQGERWAGLTHYTIDVPVTTVDIYCRERGIEKIDLLKIDTEGWDLKVIQGAAGMLPSIRYIQWEHWDEEKTGKIIHILKDYEVWILGGKPKNYAARRKN